MRKLMNSLISGLLLALGLAVGGHAAATSLFTLASTGTPIVVGGLRFDNWSFVLGQGSASDIDVTALSDGGLDPGPGLQFNFGNGFTVQGPNGSATLTIGYRVRAVEAGLLIKDNSIRLKRYELDFEDDITELTRVLINEAVGTSEDTANVSAGHVFDEYTLVEGRETHLFRSTVFSLPQEGELWAKSTISLRAVGVSGDDGGLPAKAGIIEFEERFSLQRVPEPCTLALLGIALAAGAMARRGGRQRAAARA